MNLQDHMISYVCKRTVIESLAKYSGGDESALDFVALKQNARKALRTEDGKSELRRWLKAFRTARSKMIEFDICYRAGVRFNATDWRIMDECATKMLDMLEECLIETSLEKRKPEAIKAQ